LSQHIYFINRNYPFKLVKINFILFVESPTTGQDKKISL
jgi:hypothetical protein